MGQGLVPQLLRNGGLASGHLSVLQVQVIDVHVAARGRVLLRQRDRRLVHHLVCVSSMSASVFDIAIALVLDLLSAAERRDIIVAAHVDVVADPDVSLRLTGHGHRI